MQHEFVFSGFGGQGVMFAGQLLAYAAMDHGLHTTWIPSYGPEMRGGTAHCYVVISDKTIGSPLVSRPKVGVVFNNPSFEKYEPIIAPDGVFVYNKSLIAHQVKRDDLKVVAIPASEIADQLGSMKLLNSVMLGAMLTAYPVFPFEVLEQAVKDHIPKHRRNMIDINLEAFKAGREFASNLVVAP